MTLPRPHEDVVSERVGDAVVLVHLGTNEIFSLNETGARFWELLARGESRETIESCLVEEYDVRPGDLAREIDDLLASLTRQRMVRSA